jgi:hypothetical protein
MPTVSSASNRWAASWICDTVGLDGTQRQLIAAPKGVVQDVVSDTGPCERDGLPGGPAHHPLHRLSAP